MPIGMPEGYRALKGKAVRDADRRAIRINDDVHWKLAEGSYSRHLMKFGLSGGRNIEM